ncbi:hypothetical protein AS156_27700 [Bradyrhizobium macuxiense]|uniref:Uncharacterized protein n=1 Tax=Bradyrhizobium macuxiense TaxID=1755647 RepID=A0A109K4W9_9BRAD|nr:hypothetical protein [Bradyrhizobium macuxiense]KWV60825.1 hypothetical protein AS156_27700 [Bradyrhizobium macuxiense]
MGSVRHWTSNEDEKLKELAKAGKNALEISNELTRSPSAVRRRAEILSILIVAKAYRARPSHVATHLERVAIDAIRNRLPFPAGVGPSTVAGMLEKGWIVPEGAAGRRYRVTDAGVEAVRRKIPSN